MFTLVNIEVMPTSQTDLKKQSPWEIFSIFLRLGCTSFGGPTAHLGYFRDEFVDKRKWFTDKDYADLVALCQFLSGPASSQVSMAIGLKRAGYLGMLLAWVGFTLPSVLLMVAFTLGVAQLGDISESGWLLGLKAAAVAVVAQAVYGMTKSLATGKIHALIAVTALAVVLLVPHPLIQVGAIVLGIVVGLILLQSEKTPEEAPQGSGSRTLGIVCLGFFFVLLLALPVVARIIGTTGAGIFDAFYRAGALVFGGGHVVLPLLESVTVGPGLVEQDTFLAGYGAAQAMPGPLFTFASYLGASANGVNWVAGAVIATIAIFLPAALLVLGAMPFWERIRHMPRAGAALAGANAAVVGILGAALYTPVFTAGITGVVTLSIAVACYAALTSWKVPPWAVVIGAALVGWVVL